MTYQPGHSQHPHTRFARACARLSRGLAWVYDHTAGRHHDEEESVWCAQCDEDTGPCTCTEFCGRIVCMAELDRLPEEAEAAEEPGSGRPPSAGESDPDAPWCPGCGFANYSSGPCEVCGHDDQNVPGPGCAPEASAAEDPMSGDRVAAGPGYFHDGAPAEARQAVLLRDGTLLMKTPGEPAAYDPREIDDTLVNLRPEPRSGAAAWATQLRRDQPRTWVQDLIEQSLGAPTVEIYLWNWQQRRAIAA